MDNKQTYSVSDLATVLNLPRTTINDWLNKYARFLDTELRGKRKVYSAKSLQVLQDIANFRNNGVQLLDIDKLLEDKYGIHGEVQEEKVTEKSDENSQNDGNSPSSELAINNYNPEEMTVLVKNQFADLLLQIDEANKKRNSAIRRTYALFAILMLLLFILLGAGGFLGIKLIAQIIHSENASYNHNMTEKYTSFEKNMSKNFNENNRKISDLSAKTSADLENIVTNINSQNDKLAKDLTMQQLELKKLLEDLKKENKSLELEAIKNREDFAKKQLELLENIQKTQTELEKIKSDLTKSQQSEAILKAKLEQIENAKNTANNNITAADNNTTEEIQP